MNRKERRAWQVRHSRDGKPYPFYLIDRCCGCGRSLPFFLLKWYPDCPMGKHCRFKCRLDK